MIPAKPAEGSFSLLLIEAGLTLIAVALAFALPQLADVRNTPVRRALVKLAHRKRLAAFSVGAAFLLLRSALLPLFPPPHPFSTDDFSFLLAADTFAHGRLANPTPAMWTHLESIHITMYPTYMSMYFPGQGLLMAASKVLFGNPWIGMLLTGAIMCAVLCWMLQAWLPPTWALLGGAIAVLRIGLFSYWINSYMGGATLSASGGALVLGAMPRLIKTGRFRYAMLMAIGIVLLLLSRPYEGFLLCLPVALALGAWVLKDRARPPLRVLARRAALPLALIACAVAWLGYYDYRAFGKATTPPYTLARHQYAVVPYYIWQPPYPTPHYRHAELQRFYAERETEGFYQLQSVKGFVPRNLVKLNTTVLFFAGFALLPCFFVARRVIRDRRMRFIVWSSPFWIAGMTIGVFLIPHYLAAFTGAVYALGLQAMRHLNLWNPDGRRVGQALVRFSLAVCVIMAGLRIVAEPLHIAPGPWPLGPWLSTWIGPQRVGADRAAIANQLDSLPGKHLVLVRYGATHHPEFEWVYNEADVDGAKTVWAREMDAGQNDELFRYYSDRDVWLVQPDVEQGRLVPYPNTRNMRASLAPAH